MMLISIIIPYYKKRDFIKRTIKSVKHQTYKNLEIIIIYDDNNYSDLKLLKQIKASDKRRYKTRHKRRSEARRESSCVRRRILYNS